LVFSGALIAPYSLCAKTQPTPQSAVLPVSLSLEKPAGVSAVIKRADGGPLSLTTLKMKPTDKRLYESKNHTDDFLQSVGCRKDPVSDEAIRA